LATHYGKHTRITSQCAVHSYMNPSGEEGDNLAKIVSTAFGVSKSIQGKVEPVMEVSEITGPNHRDTIFILARGYDTTCLIKAPAFMDVNMVAKMQIPPPDKDTLHAPWEDGWGGVSDGGDSS